MVEQHPEDAHVLDAIRSLGASGERVESHQLRQACDLSAARVRESVQRLRWKGRVEMDRLALTAGEQRWAKSPIATAPAVTAQRFDEDDRAHLRKALGYGLVSLERQLDVAFDDMLPRINRRIAIVRTALAKVGGEPVVSAPIVRPDRTPAKPAPVQITRTPSAAAHPAVEKPIARPAPPRAAPTPFKPWVEQYMAKVREAVAYLNGRGFGVVRASVEKSTWTVAGWSGTFSNDELVAFADAKRAEAAQ